MVCGCVAEIAVAAAHRSAHHDNALELAKALGILVDSRAQVAHGADAEQRDLAGMEPCLRQQKLDRIAVRCGRPTPCPCRLRKHSLAGMVFLRALQDRNTPNAALRQQSVHHARAKRRVTPCRSHANQFQLGALQDETQRQNIVDVVTDIGIEDDGLRLHRGRWHCAVGVRRRLASEDRCHRQTT